MATKERAKTRGTVSTPKATVLRPRAFKTRRFTKAAAKEGVSDQDLCEAVAELNLGQGDNLGGNVWKKRISQNRSRSIVLNKKDEFWIFVHLFEKQDKESLDPKELDAFKKLATDYGRLSSENLDQLVADDKLKEICNDHK